MLKANAAVLAAREHWRYRGRERPPFAEPVGPGEESVWDFPRPPALEAVPEVLEVRCGATIVARSTAAMRVCETAGAPTYYFPPGDVLVSLSEVPGESLCEWKGLARQFAVDVDGAPEGAVAWCYAETFPEFRTIAGWYAFYATKLDCFVGDERVEPQPGGYYGGWVTKRLKGPIKGEAGSSGW